MKKTILLVVAFAAQINFAQNVFPADGNVGIGTSTPTNIFTIRKTPDQNFAHIYFGEPLAISGQPSASLCFGGAGIQNSGFTWVPASNLDEGKLFLSFGGNDNGIKNPIKMTFQSNGNVGIGTVNPQQKFVVSNNGAEGFELYLDQSSSIVGLQSYNRVLNSYSKMQLDASQFSFMYGNVGIGKVNPQNKLDVNGTIHSQEVKVDMLGWSDFVFKKEYTLRTLEEVEKHINEKGHLENIPSEEEVLKNGINLGEMNAKLLQKIEELTLYMIEMKKENVEMKKRIDQIEKK